MQRTHVIRGRAALIAANIALAAIAADARLESQSAGGMLGTSAADRPSIAIDQEER
jgi:hypothetical protein